MSMPEPETLVAGAAIAVVVAISLALVFGLTTRTITIAVALAIGVDLFYPGGTTGLVVDALRPLGMFVQTETERTAARSRAVGEAADGQAPVPTR